MYLHSELVLDTVTGQLKTQPLWLVWVGVQMPPLTEIWQLYLRRFAIEHWYRLAKQTLHLTIPKLSTPEQCERKDSGQRVLTSVTFWAEYHNYGKKPAS